MLSALLGLASSCFAAETFNVRDFAAKGDGITSDTEAINQAIEAAEVKAGSEVHFPPGKYLSGTVQLKSDIVLVIEPGATLIGTSNLSEYKMFHPPAGTPEAGFKPEWHRGLILGDNVQNVTITGGGEIDGHKVFDAAGEEHMRGPHTIMIGHGRGIKVTQISIRDSANYAILLEDCSDSQITDVKITGGWDGVHFRGWPNAYCKNITIADCNLATGDDAIAGRYWENVVIADCTINSSCNGIRLIGPARKLMVNDCQFVGPGKFPHRTSNRTNMLAAIALQPGAWDPTEGVLDDVHLSDLQIHDVTTPFYFALRGSNTVGTIEVSKVKATQIYRAPCSIESWNNQPFTNVVFRDFSLEFAGGGTTQDAAIPIKSPGVDARKLPVWGFYARNVENLTLENVSLRLLKPDFRPVARLEKVKNFRTNNFQFPKVPGMEQMIQKLE
jgi:hypothetical protein